MFKISKKMGKSNQDIIGEQCIRNNHAVLEVSDEDKKIAWKSYLRSQGLYVIVIVYLSVSCSIDKDLAKESRSKMNDGEDHHL